MLYDHDSSAAVWCKSRENVLMASQCLGWIFWHNNQWHPWLLKRYFTNKSFKLLQTKWTKCIITCDKIQFKWSFFFILSNSHFTTNNQQFTFIWHMYVMQTLCSGQVNCTEHSNQIATQFHFIHARQI